MRRRRLHRSLPKLGAFGSLLLSFFACSSGPESTQTENSELPNSPGGNPSQTSPGESAPFAVPIFDNTRITSKPTDPTYQRITAPLTIDSAPPGEPSTFESAKLIVDLGTTCFPFSNWQTEPPPAGQNWPASCDAFDRNFEVALKDPADPNATAIELVHAATPFGGPMHVETDVTDIINGLSSSNGGTGQISRNVEVFISSASDANGIVSGSAGGWNVTARLEVKRGTSPNGRDVIAVIPLAHSVLKMADASKTFPFTLPAGTTSARIEYVATGHGGGNEVSPACIGPAEEFCQRSHVLTLDGTALATIDPWRNDCTSFCTLTNGGPGGRQYCKQNPCGSIASVRAPRANWCPGAVTKSKSFEPATLTGAGPHALSLAINKIHEKGNWRVSAKVFAYRAHSAE